MSVDAIATGALRVTPSAKDERAGVAAPKASFAEEMGTAISDSNQALNDAERSARELAQGKGDVVETMMALGRADVSLRMVVSLRNRMLESYQEIMRLQV